MVGPIKFEAAVQKAFVRWLSDSVSIHSSLFTLKVVEITLLIVFNYLILIDLLDN